MPLTHVFRMQMLLLFALLQCVVPLAHAHVNGDSADHQLHIAAVEALWISSEKHGHEAFAVQRVIVADHSAVVVMPQEYRCADKANIPACGAMLERLFALREFKISPPAILPQGSRNSFPYQQPCSQAPPA